MKRWKKRASVFCIFVFRFLFAVKHFQEQKKPIGMLDQKKTSVYVRKLSQLVKCADYTLLCEKYTETFRKTVSFKKMRVKKEIIFPLKWIVTEIHICMDFMLWSIIIWLDWNGMHSLYHEKLAWNIHKTCTDSHLRKKIHANKKFSSQLKIKKIFHPESKCGKCVQFKWEFGWMQAKTLRK